MTSPKILVIGDSSGAEDFAKDSLRNSCSGALVVNRARSGSRAAEWAVDAGSILTLALDEGHDSTHVWIGLGGNDFLDSCAEIYDDDVASRADRLDAKMDSIAKDIAKVVHQVQAKLPNAKIVATGYCQPRSDVGEFSGCDIAAADVAKLAQTWRKVNAQLGGNVVTFVDTLSQCGGSATSFSNDDHMHDSIHMNDKGYASMWSRCDVQEALGCAAPSRDRCTLPPKPEPMPPRSHNNTMAIVVPISVSVIVVVLMFMLYMRKRHMESKKKTTTVNEISELKR